MLCPKSRRSQKCGFKPRGPARPTFLLESDEKKKSEITSEERKTWKGNLTICDMNCMKFSGKILPESHENSEGFGGFQGKSPKVNLG